MEIKEFELTKEDKREIIKVKVCGVLWVVFMNICALTDPASLYYRIALYGFTLSLAFGMIFLTMITFGFDRKSKKKEILKGWQLIYYEVGIKCSILTVILCFLELLSFWLKYGFDFHMKGPFGHMLLFIIIGYYAYKGKKEGLEHGYKVKFK